MKEFSKELAEDRKFEIGGELLTWRYPFFKDTTAIWDEDTELVKDVNGDRTSTENAELLVKRIGVFLEPDDVSRWEKLANNKTKPIPLFQIQALYGWLFEVTSGRPTEPPSGSEPGGGASDISSEDASPSPEETPTP